MSQSVPVPRLVRLADAAVLCLVAIACWGAVTGGSRSIVLGVVVSTRAPLLYVYAAMSLAILRHLLYPRPTAWRRWRFMAEDIRARPALAASLRAFLMTRPAVFLVGLVAVAVFGFPRQVGFVLSDNAVSNLPGRFDAGWYGGIALDGYHWDHTFQRQRNIAFFPAAPLLMRPLGAAFGMYDETAPRERRMLRALWAGVVMSLVAFLWALHYLVRLGRDLIGEEPASQAALLLAAYPFSVFYSAPYSESLFLLGAVGASFHFLRGEWAKASAWGMFAGLTRPNGCFLSVPLLLTLVGPTFRSGVMGLAMRHGAVSRTPDLTASAKATASPPELQRRRKVGPATLGAAGIAAASSPIIGMMIFTLYLYGLTGVWFAWARSHEAWGRSFQGLEPFAKLATALHEGSLLEVIVGSPFNALNTVGLLFALAMVWPVTRRFGIAWGVFILMTVVPPFLAGGVLSMGRLSATLFPAFLALASMIPARHVPAWAAGFGIGQGLCAALFFTWRELY